MQTASLGEGTYRKNRASPGTDDATAPGPTTPIGKCANAFEVPATVLADSGRIPECGRFAVFETAERLAMHRTPGLDGREPLSRQLIARRLANRRIGCIRVRLDSTCLSARRQHSRAGGARDAHRANPEGAFRSPWGDDAFTSSRGFCLAGSSAVWPLEFGQSQSRYTAAYFGTREQECDMKLVVGAIGLALSRGLSLPALIPLDDCKQD
jgi:hypothetical protein